MDTINPRLLNIQLPKGRSAFLWGPRKVGKSTWLKKHYSDQIIIDLLKTDVLTEYASQPSLLRERYADTKQLIIVDEIQMLPKLLNEIHWLIENKNLSFILTGSSARKLRRSHANLLGGRAWRYTMTPLCYPELKTIDLENIMISGLMPSHLTSPNPIQDLRAYIADYLKEEIMAEAATKNIPAFSEFLQVMAITNGELLNYTNIARETGVSAKVVRDYCQILEDTLLGFRLSPWRKTQQRKLQTSEKFYLFDVGVANYLAKRQPQQGTPEFGKSFEHFILLELIAYRAYKDPELSIKFWRTQTGLEVDFILDDIAVAIEVKSSKRVHNTDAKALRILQQEHNPRRCLIISLESERKQLNNGIESWPWQHFLEQLWSGQLL